MYVCVVFLTKLFCRRFEDYVQFSAAEASFTCATWTRVSLVNRPCWRGVDILSNSPGAMTYIDKCARGVLAYRDKCAPGAVAYRDKSVGGQLI